MKPSTEIRNLLLIGLEAEDKLVTYHAYVQAAAGITMNEEQAEAFGRDVYRILLVLVLDNGFTVEAKQSFPKVRNDFALANLKVWIVEMHNWFANLSRPEQKLFRTLKFSV